MRQWPNKLGWDTGQAEVRDCGSFLRAFVPIGPQIGYNADGKRIEIARHRRMDFPVGTDPRECVRICRKQGAIHEDS